ncbi:hypothetical protein EMIHUDRAFT_221927 [Emiliania huxleyi CCMP1516]|uniref:Uncharacterized protein n=2 Tax=Emiliania huxleyi TaxID=2903 RepID=A0A0D3HXM5_EMIH1|nr:hypothetical protein EMIHUDRAFT_221927 [Emiliania huxleyi CCMP1516]EOD03760.1 hypothetical protein EMIHUDRAFT_221927 [Emiliania huxleyi CCMP1516]|eukprot:XP_005756189.1 hypothetical protein EMIHUDRAFT_221927 [Emiliania huxleyi CCMP1516]
MADGVRLTAPTILLTEPSAPRTSSSAHLPRGALLAVGSSGGRRLVCALGDGLQHLPPALGAELPELLLPKPALCGRPLDLSVGAHRLVGHPLMLRVGQPAASADAPYDRRLQYRRTVAACAVLAAELGESLAEHEAHLGSDLSRSARVPARRLATVFLWQRRVIHQLQTCLLAELSWHEGVPRRALLQMVAAFPDVLLPVLMPAVGEDFEEAQDCG